MSWFPLICWHTRGRVFDLSSLTVCILCHSDSENSTTMKMEPRPIPIKEEALCRDFEFPEVFTGAVCVMIAAVGIESIGVEGGYIFVCKLADMTWNIELLSINMLMEYYVYIFNLSSLGSIEFYIETIHLVTVSSLWIFWIAQGCGLLTHVRHWHTYHDAS